MKELILVRHGEAEHLVGNRTGGWSDTNLTESGRRQARLTGPGVAALLAGRPYQFYTSDLARARQTAEGIAETLGVEPVVRAGLRELNNGAAANRTKEEALAMQLPLTHPPYDWVPYPGAESWRMMVERLFGFLNGIANEPHDTTLIVAHGNCGVAIVHWWLGLGEAGWTRVSFDFDPCSITQLVFNKFGEPTIRRLNDTRHLLCLDGKTLRGA